VRTVNEEVLKLKIEPPEHAEVFWEDIHGMKFWKNQKNGYTVAAVHFSADPEKNSLDWFQEATRNLTQDKIDQEYHISFESKAGKRVFPYLAMNPGRWLVKPREIKKNETIIASLDFGSRNPTAILFHAVDHRGRFHTFSEFYKPSTPSEIARWLKNHPYWTRCLKVVADPSIFNSNQHDLEGGAIKSIASMLEELGIYNLEKGENDRIAGLQRMKEMLRYQEAQNLEPYWSISTDCPKLWWELCGLTYRENTDKQRLTKNEEEDVVKKDDHAFDSARYALMSWNSPSELPERKGTGTSWTMKEIEEEIDDHYDREEALDRLV
jgi:hypothetical protein